MRHEEQADALDAEVGRLEREGEELDKRIDGARSDWRSKQADASVPGAVEDPDAQDDDAGDEGEQVAG